MDKTVIFAVAGSGKTSSLIDSLNETRRFLIVTYTDANFNNLRVKIIQKFGYFPQNINLFTYFSFLHGFCYQPFLRSVKNTKGLTFEHPPNHPRHPMSKDLFFMTANRRLYSNRLAKYIVHSNLVGAVIARMEKYFDSFLVDEIQDFAGHDFNFLLAISDANLKPTFVGDFFQHTFDTSRDGPVNAQLHQNYDSYAKTFEAAKFFVDKQSLVKSRRCSDSVCRFITDKIGIAIEAHSAFETSVKFEDDPTTVSAIYHDPTIVKLFYKEHYKYHCYSQNWGASKGVDNYHDVCVVLNQKNTEAWETGSFRHINSETRNKLYVACSRARGNLTLVPDSLLRQYKEVSKLKAKSV